MITTDTIAYIIIFVWFCTIAFLLKAYLETRDN